MRELSHLMYSPEYSITNEILKNIASAEYSRALVENTTILQKWQDQLQDTAKAKTITFSLQRAGLNVGLDRVKKYIRKMPVTPMHQVVIYENALTRVTEMAKTSEFYEKDIKEIYKLISGKSQYRNVVIESKTPPEAILAQITELVDWFSSLDAMDTHPIVKAGIFKARMEEIQPFEKEYSVVMSDLVTILSLKINNFNIKDFYSLEEYYLQSRRRYIESMDDVIDTGDYTIWLEYFSEGISHEIANLAENVKIMARDTKLATAAGDSQLTERQERLIEYIQNYGMLTNKDFPAIFPDISEDTVLRELKDLTDKQIIIKKGKTKSSRYVLR